MPGWCLIPGPEHAGCTSWIPKALPVFVHTSTRCGLGLWSHFKLPQKKPRLERSMANTIAEAVVRKSVRVQAPVERAFTVFVEQMETWWPATHHIGKTPFEAIFVAPRVGGRRSERKAPLSMG